MRVPFLSVMYAVKIYFLEEAEGLLNEVSEEFLNANAPFFKRFLRNESENLLKKVFAHVILKMIRLSIGSSRKYFFRIECVQVPA